MPHGTRQSRVLGIHLFEKNWSWLVSYTGKFVGVQSKAFLAEHGWTRLKGLEREKVRKFDYAGKNDKKIKYFKVWQDGNDAKEIHSTAFLEEKMNYIHNNPVKAELVANPQDYLYS